MEIWNGYELRKTVLNGRNVVIQVPQNPNGKWTLKTEYFDAFPDVQLKLLERGYYVAHIQNITRWHVWEDTDARAELAEYMHRSYGVSKKCVIIGMSCGGMQGIYFAAKYPQYVSCMYLDAPVINFLSCPANMGKATEDEYEEFENATGFTKQELLSYRQHPLDYIPGLAKNNIPVILICGDTDCAVPYEENGKLLNDEYEKAGAIIKTIIKENCGHHPHGLEENMPIIDFIKEYDV